MLAKRVIPCLDVNNGRVVKGIKFTGLRDAGDPEELAQEYDRQGADELVFLDISATLEGRKAHLEIISKIRKKLSIPLTTGGGVKGVDDVSNLLTAGADKVSVNTAAVKDPQIIYKMSQNFGSQCTVIAIDAAKKLPGSFFGSGWEVVICSGRDRTGIDVLDWAKRAAELGAGEILLTSFDRDGSKSGYDLDLIKAVSSLVNIPVIASGGASEPRHFVEAVSSGAEAVLAASVFHYGKYVVEDIKKEMRKAGIEVRL